MKYPQIFANTIDSSKSYVFVEDSTSDDIVGLLNEGGKESIKRFKNEDDVKRKRSAMISSGEWRLVSEIDRDTGLKLPIYMYPSYDISIKWAAEWFEDATSGSKIIRSTFSKEGEESQMRDLTNMNEVKQQYDLLKENKWMEVKQPEIVVKYAEPETEDKKNKRIKEQALQARLMEILEKERSNN